MAIGAGMRRGIGSWLFLPAGFPGLVVPVQYHHLGAIPPCIRSQGAVFRTVGRQRVIKAQYTRRTLPELHDPEMVGIRYL